MHPLPIACFSFVCVSVFAGAIATTRPLPSAPNGSPLLGPSEPGFGYCAGDGLDPLVTVPCAGNFGVLGHGCGNANNNVGGPYLTATGTTNPNTVLFRFDFLPPGVSMPTLLRGTADVPAGFASGNGVRCVSGSLHRSPLQSSGSSFLYFGTTPTVSPGSTRYYQVQYRYNTSTFNVSNGYVITW